MFMIEEKRYLALLRVGEQRLSDALLDVARRHGDDHKLHQTMMHLAKRSEEHVRAIDAVMEGMKWEGSWAEPFHRALFDGDRAGSIGLLRDLHDLVLLSTHVQNLWTVLTQTAEERRNSALLLAAFQLREQVDRQIAWLVAEIRVLSAHAPSMPVPVGGPKQAVSRERGLSRTRPWMPLGSSNAR
jgi:hypothetical protein